MRAWLHVTPQTSVHGNRAELRLNFGTKMFVAVFGCRKKAWPLRHIEIRRGEQTATFTPGELATAMAALLGHEPLAPTPPGDQRHRRATDRHHAPRTAHCGDPRMNRAGRECARRVSRRQPLRWFASWVASLPRCA